MSYSDSYTIGQTQRAFRDKRSTRASFKSMRDLVLEIDDFVGEAPIDPRDLRKAIARAVVVLSVMLEQIEAGILNQIELAETTRQLVKAVRSNKDASVARIERRLETIRRRQLRKGDLRNIRWLRKYLRNASRTSRE